MWDLVRDEELVPADSNSFWSEAASIDSALWGQEKKSCSIKKGAIIYAGGRRKASPVYLKLFRNHLLKVI